MRSERDLTRLRRYRGMVAVLLSLCLAPSLAWGGAKDDGLQLERVVLVARHGVRAPLDGEAAAAHYADAPWPHWDTPASLLTPHGREGVRLSGVYLREWLRQAGVLPAQGCPAKGAVAIWANTDARTIDSGQLLADALAPGCGIVAGHREPGSNDPLFRPVEAGAVAFDAKAAVASILRENGGPAALVAAHREELESMQALLGCGNDCDFAAMPSTLAASENGRGLSLHGPVDLTSGTGEVFLLQYAEGLPLDQVAWGRATPQRLEAASRLHALLFDVYARPRYMATRAGAPLAREVLARLGGDDAAAVSLFVGSDTHIAALSSLLGVHFHLPGYGADDPPPGGMLAIERWRDRKSGVRYVRVEYLAQSLDQLRDLQVLDLGHPLLRQVLGAGVCGSAATSVGCPLDVFVAGLREAARPALP
jgi:4-phytase/acid phosphatase